MYKKFYKEYFSFSSSERKGIIVLIVLMFLLLLIPYIYSLMVNINGKEDISSDKFTREISSFEASLKPIKNTNSSFKNNTFFTVLPFDPNTVSSKDLIKMGINKRLVQTLVNFRNKGGKFKRKEDLLKLYGMDTVTFLRLQPYIIIPNTFSGAAVKPTQFQKPKVELNSADSAGLEKLPLIGPKFASRIIRFRNALGGFYSINQLKEVYGINDSIFNMIKNRLTVDTLKLKKIDLNTASQADLRRHPYISKYEAASIMKYKEIKKGRIEVTGLKNDNILSSATYRKVLPYFR